MFDWGSFVAACIGHFPDPCRKRRNSGEYDYRQPRVSALENSGYRAAVHSRHFVIGDNRVHGRRSRNLNSQFRPRSYEDAKSKLLENRAVNLQRWLVIVDPKQSLGLKDPGRPVIRSLQALGRSWTIEFR